MILPCTASTSYGNFSGLVLHRGILEQFRGDVSLRRSRGRVGRIQSLILEPSPNDNAGESAADFIKRTERAWMISKQPRPMKCTSCEASGSQECAWCKGTGFFILGDSMLCEVPSRNTQCVICSGQGAIPCKDCRGTGFRARWLGPPPEENPDRDLRRP